mmetsp:Transcript_14383/g.38831  ORF Transcript_14383/g.38831 Transcript_14383/m.38831 type:complete len:261 (-) Transcript_14383:1811-2593(-)
MHGDVITNRLDVSHVRLAVLNVCERKLSNRLAHSIIGVGIGQEVAHCLQHLGHGQSGRPVVVEDVKAQAAAIVDVAMEHGREETHARGLERVVRWQVDGQHPRATLEWASHRAFHECTPLEQVSLRREHVDTSPCTEGGKVTQLLHDAPAHSWACMSCILSTTCVSNPTSDRSRDETCRSTSDLALIANQFVIEHGSHEVGINYGAAAVRVSISHHLVQLRLRNAFAHGGYHLGQIASVNAPRARRIKGLERFQERFLTV